MSDRHYNYKGRDKHASTSYMSKSKRKREAFNYRKAYFEKNPGLFGCIWFCSQCGIPMFGKDNVQVDHIIPLEGLGINRTINTVAICPRCNREKSDKCGKYAVKGVIAKFFEAALFTIQKIVLQVFVFILKILHGIVTGITRAVGTVFSLFSTEAKIIIVIIVALVILLIFI